MIHAYDLSEKGVVTMVYPTSTIENSRYVDLAPATLLEHALAREEGVLSASKALVVSTGSRTGRSPKDRFIVRDPLTENTVHWGNVNQSFEPERFTTLWGKAQKYIESKEHFISHLTVGADPRYALSVAVVTELAWHTLFVNHLFIRTTKPQDGAISQWTLLCAPGFKTDPKTDGTQSDAVILLSFEERKILILGTLYAGEMKKAMFSVLNFLLPAQDVLPMHCASNVGKKNDVALFFGLSGTGKTTLSSDPTRFIIGDDEHGWSRDGIFNFEGGCYAKCINLSQKNEPLIWNAIRTGAVLENVVLDPETHEPNYADVSLTQNTRAAYPREYITPRSDRNFAHAPEVVIFLSCDLYGVLPPVALLSPTQAAYYFISGYTALVGSTEVGQKAPIQPTFSTCFGAPFFPRPAQVYADLLIKRLKETNASVYLVNTGWGAGGYERGTRFPIPVTRQIISHIVEGNVAADRCTLLEGFNFLIPETLLGIEPAMLDPRRAWQENGARYREQSSLLRGQFIENFKRFHVAEEIVRAGPEC